MASKEKWEGRSKGSLLGYKIFISLLRHGGLKPAYALLHFVKLYYRYFVPSATQPLQYFYQQRLHFSKKKAAEMISKNITIFGQTLIDKLAVLANIPNQLTFTHDGVENIEKLVAAGKGGILLSAHLGNWEAAGHLLKRVGAPINIVMYDGEAEAMKQLMAPFENNRSFNVIRIKDDLSHIYEISAALTRNELICLHGDRFRPGQRTMEQKFLGENALFPAGPFILAAKLKAPVCVVFAFKETDFHYHFYAAEARQYSGKGTEGMERMLDDFIHHLEHRLKQYPEQWFNYYHFWKA